MLVDDLFTSISERWMPETVVKTILDARLSEFSKDERKFLSRALPRWAYSSMSSTFAKADDLQKQLAVAETLFGVAAPPAQDAVRVGEYLETLKGILHVGGTDFKADRLVREDRKKIAGVPKGHRAYNKRFRLLHRLCDKCGRWLTVANLRDLAQIAKSRLATRIEEVDFKRDVESACFLAYMVARLNKRSVFTFGRQERPYDEVADFFFKRLGTDASWFAIAHVHSVPEVLAVLLDEERGRLLGLWYSVMVRAARVLENNAAQDRPDLVQMIVRRGNDSSTWNEAAGAFNKARDGWIATLHALGGEALLEQFAPGKALRLMAADVARGHRVYGDGLEPDTAVWGALPKPWEVVLGGTRCTREQIEQACAHYGIVGKGWITPRPKSVAAFKPTPELVHGVVVSSPDLADVLKNLGYFGGSSKATKVRGGVSVSRNMDGLTPTVSWD